MKKLELSSLSADLSNVERLLNETSDEIDPIGYFQLNSRKKRLMQQIEDIKSSPINSASVAMFFGGAPVVGSRGISADFAGKAIGAFQDIVSKKFATLENGSLGERGPIPLKSNTDLILTDVARGSFGLILEEDADNQSLTSTALNTVIDDVTQTIVDLASRNENEYETALALVDSRSLFSYRDFFKLLDDQGATIRLVEGNKDIDLGNESIHLARLRTDFSKIEDKDTDQLVGRLFILPANRRFELQLMDSYETISGAVSSEFSKDHLLKLQQESDVLGKVWKTKIRIRETLRPNQAPKLTYTLLGLIEKMDYPHLK